MSKIFIISNTNFNISKNISSKEWLKNMEKYYYDDFIPYLIENKKPNDILIHLGNLITKTKNIDLIVIDFIQTLFEKISDILPVYIIEGENDKLSLNILKKFKNIEIIREPKQIELLVEQRFTIFPNNTSLDDFYNFDSDFCFLNFDITNSPNKDIITHKLNKFKKCYNGYYDKNEVNKNIKNLGSPYNTENDSIRGFIILDTYNNTDKFIKNKTSPNFKKIKINSESDLNINKDILKNNYISLCINKKLLIDYQLRINMLISENEISNVSYSDEEITKDKEEIELSENTLSLNDMIIDFINKSDSGNKDKMLDEFKNIIELNKK